MPPLSGGEAQMWTSPAVRLRDAVPREETLALHVHPDLRFTDWRPGRYRVVKTAMEADGTRVLTLMGGGFEPVPLSVPARPQARVTPTGAEYQARQIAWRQVQARNSSLTCQLTY